MYVPRQCCWSSMPREFHLSLSLFLLSEESMIHFVLCLAPSVTVKAIGLFLKTSALQSRVSSCSSRSSKNTDPTNFDGQTQSPPLKFYPASGHSNARQSMVNYQSQGNLTSNNNARQAFVSTTTSPHRLSSSKVQHTTTTAAATNGHKLMPT